MPATGAPTWSEDKWRENILRYQLRHRAESIKRLAMKLEHSGDFPTETPKKLAQLIKHSADVVGGHLVNAPADQLRHVNWFLCMIGEQLRFVERSRVANTPWSMIHGTEEFLKRQARTPSEFIIRPQWSYNYSLMGEFVEAYRTSFKGLHWIPISSWEASIGTLAQNKIYCISFPRIERLNCLLHANWGHEVGHIIASEWIESSFAQLWQSEEIQVKNTIELAIRKNPPPVDPLFSDILIQQIVAEQANTSMQAAKQGLAELICDAIGVHLLGPAALAAAAEFSIASSIDENPITCDMYPPWRYRLRLMVEECEEDLKPHPTKLNSDIVNYPGSIIEPFYNWLREIIDLVKDKADIQSLQANITTREAYRVIEANWERIRTEALELLPQKSQEPYQFLQEVRVIEELVIRLEQDTPPNELGTWPENSAARLEDILNAAWVFKIKKMGEDPNWGSADDFEKLFRLVLKATEASFVQRTFGPKLKQLEQ